MLSASTPEVSQLSALKATLSEQCQGQVCEAAPGASEPTLGIWLSSQTRADDVEGLISSACCAAVNILQQIIDHLGCCSSGVGTYGSA